jgi:hypothetical protein
MPAAQSQNSSRRLIFDSTQPVECALNFLKNQCFAGAFRMG